MSQHLNVLRHLGHVCLRAGRQFFPALQIKTGLTIMRVDMFEEFDKLNTKAQNITELKVVLQTILDSLPYKSVCKSVESFFRKLAACIHVKAHRRHFEDSIN